MQGHGNSTSELAACTVIICVRNGAETLRTQLDALAHQADAPPFEVLVVNNGSSDGTVAVYDVWAAGDFGSVSSTRLVDASARPGLAYARNRGAAEAVGHMLAYCDADDRVHPGWVAAACTALGNGLDAVGGEIRRLSRTGEPDPEVFMDRLDGISPVDGALKDYPFFWGCSFALTTDAFVAAGGFDESLPPYGCDDMDIGVRLGQRGIRIGYSPDMIVYYSPPTGLRRRLTRKFRAGIAQACLWERHPSTYAEASLTRLAVSLPRELVETAQEAGSARTRVLRVAELMASRAGRAWGVLTWVRSGRLGPARYFGGGPR